jgi:hypothetical protein
MKSEDTRSTSLEDEKLGLLNKFRQSLQLKSIEKLLEI